MSKTKDEEVRWRFLLSPSNEAEETKKLIAAIPDSWQSVCGALMTEGGPEVAEGISVIYMYPSSQPQISFTDRTKAGGRCLFSEIFVERMKASCIEFDQAGLLGDPASFSKIKAAILRYADQGYGGSLSFYSQFIRGHTTDYPAWCSLRWGGSECRIVLGIHGEHGGTGKDVQMLLTACQELGLKQVV